MKKTPLETFCERAAMGIVLAQNPKAIAAIMRARQVMNENERQVKAAADRREAERLDRLRNPGKYLGVDDE